MNLSPIGRALLRAWSRGDPIKLEAVVRTVILGEAVKLVAREMGVPHPNIIYWRNDYRRCMADITANDGIDPADLVQSG